MKLSAFFEQLESFALFEISAERIKHHLWPRYEISGGPTRSEDLDCPPPK